MSLVSVAKLGSTQLSGAALDEGTVIYNTDAVNAVWVASSQSVSPGNGFRIKPLGNVTWSNKMAWACVDTGVNAAVVLNVSSDINSYTDPTAEIIGQIVAQISGTISADIVSSIALDIDNILNAIDTNVTNALLDVQGQSQIVQLLNSVSIPASGFSANINISKYSEIIIVGLTGSPFLYFLNDSVSGMSMDTDYVAGRAGTFPCVRLAAVGDQLVFQNLDSVAGSFSVWGTNRVAQGRYNAHQNTGLVREWFDTAKNRTAGNDYNVPYVTPAIDGDPFGEVFVSVEVGNGANVCGYFWISDSIGGNKLRLINGDKGPDSDGVIRNYNVVGWPAFANQVGFHCTKGAPASAFLRLQAAFVNP